MNITEEKIDALNSIVRLSFSPEDYTPLVEASLKNIRKNANLKGFRKGQTPPSLVKKMYGNTVLIEEINKLINQELDKFLKAQNIAYLGQPIPHQENPLDIDINSPIEYEFGYQLGLEPEISIDVLNKELSFTMYQVEADNKIIEDEIAHLQKKLGTVINPVDSKVESDDVLSGKWIAIKSQNQDNPYTYQSSFPIDMIDHKSIKQQLLELKIGDAVTIPIFDAVSSKTKKEIAKHFLGLEDENPEIHGIEYEFKLEKINRVELAPLDEEFFKNATGDETITDIDTFKKFLKNNIEKHFVNQSRLVFQQQFRSHLLSLIPISLPDNFLKNWLESSNEKQLKREDIEKEYPYFSKNLKWQLITKQIAKEYQISVSEEDILNETKNKLKEYFRVSEDQMDSIEYEAIAKNLLANKDHAKKTADEIGVNKIFDCITSLITIQTEKVSVKEFEKIIEESSQKEAPISR